MDKKEQTRNRVQRYRDKQKALQGDEDVTLKVVADVTPELTPLGKTVESMYPSEREIWDKLGIDIRTEVYTRLLSTQRGESAVRR